FLRPHRMTEDFITTQLRVPLGTHQRPLLFFGIHTLQEVLHESHNPKEAAMRLLGVGPGVTPPLLAQAEDLLGLWAKGEDRLVSLIDQNLNQSVETGPDWLDIGRIYDEMAENPLRLRIRTLVEAWVDRQPATQDALAQIEEAYAFLRLDPDDEECFTSPRIA